MGNSQEQGDPPSFSLKESDRMKLPSLTCFLSPGVSCLPRGETCPSCSLHCSALLLLAFLGGPRADGELESSEGSSSDTPRQSEDGGGRGERGSLSHWNYFHLCLHLSVLSGLVRSLHRRLQIQCWWDIYHLTLVWVRMRGDQAPRVLFLGVGRIREYILQPASRAHPAFWPIPARLLLDILWLWWRVSLDEWHQILNTNAQTSLLMNKAAYKRPGKEQRALQWWTHHYL